MDAITQWVLDAAASIWVFPAVALLTVADAFLVVVPSETIVVALGSLSASSGSPHMVALIVVAAVSAMIGDSLTFALGRRLGAPLLARVRSPRVQSVFEWARIALERRAALVIFIARYIPFGRVAVNLVAGATGFAYRRFLPLSALACTAWAVYNVALGAAFGAWLGDYPVVAVAVSIVVAIAVGLLIDAIRVRRERRRAVE
ncbi:VTT domain-containing protein [Microcella sp.]|uniref:DedA family protein n=1 Tax=Microcella sp. TaxID=1913979 RepID=UPI002606FBDF|nr:VTT domain-containing protein [Microcella sp.]